MKYVPYKIEKFSKTFPENKKKDENFDFLSHFDCFNCVDKVKFSIDNCPWKKAIGPRF